MESVTWCVLSQVLVQAKLVLPSFDQVDTARNLVYVRGQVPGPAGRMVLLRDAYNVKVGCDTVVLLMLGCLDAFKCLLSLIRLTLLILIPHTRTQNTRSMTCAAPGACPSPPPFLLLSLQAAKQQTAAMCRRTNQRGSIRTGVCDVQLFHC